jgi:hypothetical protein
VSKKGNHEMINDKGSRMCKKRKRESKQQNSDTTNKMKEKTSENRAGWIE